jgi:uncharacterized repeat protein (TIGR02543 family)
MNKKLFLLGMVSVVLAFGVVVIGCEPTQGVPGPAGADGQAAAGVHSSIPPDSPLYNATWATDNWTAKTGVGIIAASNTSIKSTNRIENTAATVAQQGRDNALDRVIKSYSAVGLPDGKTFIILEYVTVSTETLNSINLVLSGDKQSIQYGTNTLTKKTGADPASFTVHFDSDGGSSVGDAENVEPTGLIPLPTPPTKDAYFFMGWYTDEEHTTLFTAATPVIANITLYAKWVEGDALTVDTWTDGNIAEVGGKQHFQFTATTAQQFIHVELGTLDDLWVYLYDGNGSPVGERRNLYGSTKYASFGVTIGAVYNVQVTPYDSSEFGLYKLIINESETAPAL